MERHEALVAGGGACGLAAAAMLGKEGVPALVLDRASELGSSWRGRYDTLRLNTWRFMSTLPRYRMPRRYGPYPTRDEVAEYLQDYARRERLDVQLDTEVRRIDRTDGDWQVETSRGPFRARTVVVATGYDVRPKLPEWPGQESFGGELIHAREYKSADPYRGRDVLVVGAGNTGTEIAYWLLRGGARRVRVCMRTPPNVFPRKWLGSHLNVTALLLEALPVPVADRMGQLTQRMIFGDLSRYGLPRAPHGIVTNLQRGVAPAIDCGFIEALKAGEIELVGVIDRFEGPDVVLADGERLRPDAVIAATGYERGLEPLVGHLGVLRPDGHPVAPDGRANPQTPGLYFVGYVPAVSGQLRQARVQARRLARAVARDRGAAAQAA